MQGNCDGVGGVYWVLVTRPYSSCDVILGSRRVEPVFHFHTTSDQS